MKIFVQILALFTLFSTACAQGTAFTYQGLLMDGANAATGVYDLRFELYDAASEGTQWGNALTNSATGITNGSFTVTLDFGNQFPGANRWLEIGVRTNGATAFVTLAPRQAITPTPYSIYAASASNVNGSVSASQLTGALSLAQLPSSVITNGATNVAVSGAFTGDGSGLTNVAPSANTVTNGSPIVDASLELLSRSYADGWLNVPIGFNNWFADGGINENLYTNHINAMMGTNTGCDMRAMLAPWGKQPYMQIDESFFGGFDSNGIPTLVTSGGWNHPFSWYAQLAHTNGIALGVWIQGPYGVFCLAMANCNPKVLADYFISNHVDYIKLDALYGNTSYSQPFTTNLSDNALQFVSYMRGAPYPVHISGAGGTGQLGDLKINNAFKLFDSYRATGFVFLDAMGNEIGGDAVPGGAKPLMNFDWADVALTNAQLLGPNLVPDFDPMSDENWPGCLRYCELTTFFSSPFQFGQSMSPIRANFENIYSNILSGTSIKIRRDLYAATKIFSTNGVDFITKPNSDGGCDLLLENRNYSESLTTGANGSSVGPGYQLDLFTNTLSLGGDSYAYVFHSTNVTVDFSQIGLSTPVFSVFNAESDGVLTCTNGFNINVPAGATRLFRITPPIRQGAYRYLSNEKWFLYTNCAPFPNYPYYNNALGSPTWQLRGSSTVYSNGVLLINSSMVSYGVNGASTFNCILGTPVVAPAGLTNTITVFLDGVPAAAWLTPNSYVTNVSLSIPAGTERIDFQAGAGAPCYMTLPMLKTIADGSALTGLVAADGSPVMGTATPVSLRQLPSVVLTNNANGVTLNGIISMQPKASTFNWAAIPPYSATTTNYWLGTWTNGTFVCIWSNTPSTYKIKQLAP